MVRTYPESGLVALSRLPGFSNAAVPPAVFSIDKMLFDEIPTVD
jgi:hypothetical protein